MEADIQQSVPLEQNQRVEEVSTTSEPTQIVRVPHVEQRRNRLLAWLLSPSLSSVFIFLALYLGISLFLWGIAVLDVVSQQFHVLSRMVGGPIEASEPLTLIALTICGGAIGGNIYSFDKLVKYATKENKDDRTGSQFNLRHSMDYIMRQFIAAALGAVFFVLVMGGFINVDQLTGASADAGPAMDQSSGYFAFALGFLVGFGSYQVTRKLDQVIKVMFGRLGEEDLKPPA